MQALEAGRPGVDASEFRLARCVPVPMPVPDLTSYRLGTYRSCGPECGGHYCTLPNGATLPPERYATFGEEPNPLGRAILAVAESGDTETYDAALKAIMNGKEGLFRAGVFGPVSGSLRMPMIPAPDYPRGSIVVPRHIATNLVVSYHGREVRMIDCQVALYNRPPTMYPGSIRPVKLFFWDRAALGLPLDQTTESHADFDGDEGHVYPLVSPMAIAEVATWSLPGKEPGLEERAAVHGARLDPDDWMVGTTHPIDAVRENFFPLCSLAGCKEDLEQDFVERLRGEYQQSSYSVLAMQGCDQIVNQQLSQGSVGHRFRVARTVLSEPHCHGGMVHSCFFSFRCTLYPCLPGYLAACAICARLQQRALDSHRAGHVAGGLSISSLILDGDGRDLAISLLSAPPPATWKVLQVANIDGYVVCVTAGNLHPTAGVLGTTSPYLLMGHRDPHAAYLRGLAIASKLGRLHLSEPMLKVVVCCVVPAMLRGCMYPLSVEGSGSSNCKWLTRLSATWWTRMLTYPDCYDWEPTTTLKAAALFASYTAMPTCSTYHS